MDDAYRILKCHGHFYISKKQKYLEENCFNLHSLRNCLLYQPMGISNQLHLMGKSLWYFIDVIVKFACLCFKKC